MPCCEFLGSLTFVLCIAWSALAADGAKATPTPGKAAAQADKPRAEAAVESGAARMVMVEVMIADARQGKTAVRQSDSAKGAPAESATDGKARLERFPLEKAEKLDVLRIPASAADAKAIAEWLENPGKRHVVTRVKLATVAGQTAHLQVGERVARITGSQITRAGRVNNTTMEDFGTMLSVTPQIRQDGRIVMAIELLRSQPGPAEEGTVIAKASDGEEVRLASTQHLSTRSTINALSGQSVVLGSEQIERQKGGRAILIVVTPKLLDHEPSTAPR